MIPIPNALRVMGFIVAYYFYFRHENIISRDHAILVNFIVVPMTIGFATYLSLNGDFFLRMGFLAAIPVIMILLVGGDPAKPGVDLILIGPLIVIFWVGGAFAAGIASLARKYAQK